MKSKCERSLKTVSSLYSSSESLTYDDFCTVLGTVAAENDIYFYVEAMDNSFYISSVDDLGFGRPFKGSRELMDKAKLDLVFGSNEIVSVSSSDKTTHQETIVYATASKGKGVAPIYIYAVTSLTPIGPAIGIMRSLLLIVTFVSLALAMIISIVLSRRLSNPIIRMNNKAKELASGNYDVTFEGGHKFREMDQLADTLTEAAVDLKKSDALQKDLMANVSHDLRTPLTMIKSYAEMIRDLSGDNPAKRDEHLGVIISETDRLSDLVNDVLTLSKMQAGVTEMEIKPFDIQKAAESVLSTFMVMEKEGYSIHFIPVASESVVNGDERKIQQVISNLLSNAVRYSGDEKDITLAFNVVEDKIRCSVADKGPGIADEEQEKIWHRYEKASSRGQRSQGTGTGLGLSIAAEILEKHNAIYGLNSKEGEGSTFWFELPLA